MVANREKRAPVSITCLQHCKHKHWYANYRNVHRNFIFYHNYKQIQCISLYCDRSFQLIFFYLDFGKSKWAYSYKYSETCLSRTMNKK